MCGGEPAGLIQSPEDAGYSPYVRGGEPRDRKRFRMDVQYSPYVRG